MDGLILRLNQQGLLGRLLRILQKLGLLVFAFRVYEWLIAFKAPAKQARPVQADKDSYPLPPPDLRVLVAGTPSAEWFVNFGEAMFQTIVSLLRQQAVPAENLRAVLEFGCGCGRVLRYWDRVHGPTIYGTDYNPRLIAWCRANLPFATTDVNQLQPPLSYADQSLDFIYVISVFTHLAPESQMAWINELTRILTPGGYLLITTHGESFRHKMRPTELAAFEAGQLVVRFEETSGTNLCSAYHPQAYVRSHLAQGYEICQFVPAGQQEAIHQDIYLLRKLTKPILRDICI